MSMHIDSTMQPGYRRTNADLKISGPIAVRKNSRSWQPMDAQCCVVVPRARSRRIAETPSAVTRTCPAAFTQRAGAASHPPGVSRVGGKH
jgi:hypothetical protein